MAASTSELKKQIIELLKSDEEFRYMVAGLIGLREVLGEIRRLREQFNKLWLKSLEYNKRFEVIERKLLEHDKRFEVIERKLLEHDKKFEAILDETKRIWLALNEHNRRIGRIELELGALIESFYSKALWDDLREDVKAKGEKVLRRERGIRLDNVDIDLLVETDKSVYVVEVKVKPKHEDVGVLLSKADIVRKHYPDKRIVVILAGAYIGREVRDYAREKGVEVYVY